MGCGLEEEGMDSLMALEIAAVSLPRRTSKTRKVRTESSIEAPWPDEMPDGTGWVCWDESDSLEYSFESMAS